MRHLEFLKTEILMTSTVKRINVRHCAKFIVNRSKHCEIWRFFDFVFKMAAVHYLGIVMCSFGTPTKTNWWIYHCGKNWLESMQ